MTIKLELCLDFVLNGVEHKGASLSVEEDKLSDEQVDMLVSKTTELLGISVKKALKRDD